MGRFPAPFLLSTLIVLITSLFYKPRLEPEKGYLTYDLK